MKIIGKYLVERFGEIIEVIELENSNFYYLSYFRGEPSYKPIDADEFYQLQFESKTKL